MSYPNRGGRVAPDNRGPSVSGVGKNSKRTDMERRSVPFLHDSDLQQGDVQAMEQGQRIAPKQTQRPAAPAPAGGSGTQTEQTGTGAVDIPDPIEFLGGLSDGPLTEPVRNNPQAASKAATWLPILTQLASGPGSSGLLASAIINQARALRRIPRSDAMVLDLHDVDRAIEAMLDEGV